MTYCVAVKVDEGIVALSDTRTNAGIDYISRYRKSFTWFVPGERAICLMTAGNLSITQGILTRVGEQIRRAEAGESLETILNAGSMFRVAQIIAGFMREMQDLHRLPLMNQGIGADATILVSGQRAGGTHRVYMLYSAGNFIEATPDTPFLQAGEHKYGKPVLDRMIRPETPLADALKATFVSMDSTLRSNLSVGMPLDLVVLPANELRFTLQRRIEVGDSDWEAISASWSSALREGFGALPPVTVR